jgi:flagellar protein FlbD
MVHSMISLTRLSGSVFVLNSDLLERVDSTPDTVITLVDGSKYVVAESMRAVVAAVRLHRAEVIALSAYVQVAPESLFPGTGYDAPAREPGAPGDARAGRLATVAGATEDPPSDDDPEPAETPEPHLARVLQHPAIARDPGRAEGNA